MPFGKFCRKNMIIYAIEDTEVKHLGEITNKIRRESAIKAVVKDITEKVARRYKKNRMPSQTTN